MVIISEKSVEKIIYDVAPKIEELTGWETFLDTLNIKIITADQLWKEGILKTYESLGIDVKAKTEDGKKTIMMAKKTLPHMVLGQYEQSSDTLLVIPDNLRIGTNLSGLKTIIGHELTHRCQAKNNPEFSELYKLLVRRHIGTNAFDIDDKEDKTAGKYVQAHMTLTEGDATFVQKQLQKIYYPDAQNKTGGITKLLGLALFAYITNGGKNGISEDYKKRMLENGGGLLGKIKQYTQGAKFVEKIYDAQGREAVNDLYHLNEKELYRKIRESKSPVDDVTMMIEKLTQELKKRSR